MKSYRYALSILGAGLVLLGGLVLWQWGRVSPSECPRPAALLGSNAEIHRAVSPSAPALPPTAGAAPGHPFLDGLAGTLAALEAEPNPMAREEKLQALVDAIALSDISAALKLLQDEKQTDLHRELQVRLIRHGAATNPYMAAALAEQMPTGVTRSASLGGVAVVWATQDLAEAAWWASQLPEGEDRQTGLTQVAYEAARTEPQTALQLAADLSANDARDELIRHATLQWATQEPEGASAWAKEIPNATLREQVLADIAATWGETDPVAAAKLALQSLPPGKLQEDAVVGIAQRWVQKEPENAAAWVVQFPAGALQQAALENVVKLWADADAAQAEKWVTRLPAGNQRDTAAGFLANWLSSGSPATAVQWAESIGDPSERQRQMEAIAASWLESDGAAARAWIMAGSLTDVAKGRLLGSEKAMK